MTLAPGTRLGPYDITAAIGAGGMGEVYRGRDATLNRDVAIKVLPAAMAGDAERLARFKREAQLLASLNHPNVAQIFGFDGAALQDGSTAHFLAMEMVEGEDLAERLKRGAIPTDEAIAIARQIADGLEEAHERGIIHRDLKPANVKVTPDGKVKVLDFGLAKALEGDPSSSGGNSQLSHSPTMSRHMTEAGMIMGTAAYMSPEQARGKTVDRRADIWAFGVVLFEMLTGTRLFVGETVSDTLAAVLKTDPDWSLLPTDTPPTVKRLLRRCLEKDTKRRLGWIGGFRHELDEPGSLDRESALTRPDIPGWRRLLPLAGAALVGVALAGFFGWNRPPGGVMQVSRLSIETPSTPDDLLISPSGRHVFLVRGSTLEVRSMSEFDAAPLKIPYLQGMSDIAFSPDGESIAFVSGSMLSRVPVAGGVVVNIADLKAEVIGCSWPDEHLYCGLGAQGIARVAAAGGPVERIVKVAPGEYAATPRILPGGDALLFSLAPGSQQADWARTSIVVQSLSSGRRDVVAASGSDPRYLPTGHITYAVEGVWFALAFDAKALRAVGPPVPVIQGVARRIRGGLVRPRAFIDVSANGTLIYLDGPVARSDEREVVFADRSGRERILKLAPRGYEGPRVSPDGRQVALSISERDEAAVWIYDLSEAFAIRRLTFAGRSRVPVWSPDGKRVAFQSDRDGAASIYVQAADGSGGATQLTTAAAGTTHIPESWSRDGVLSYSVGTANGVELWLRSMRDGSATRFGDVLSNAPLNSALSPDGKWIAYGLRALGTNTANAVVVQPVPATGARYQVSDENDRSHHPFWSRDGKELFYFGNRGNSLVSTTLAFNGGLTAGRPLPVPGDHPSNTTALSQLNYDITPDGRGFVFTRPVSGPGAGADAQGGRSSVKVVLNWFEELKRLVPARP